MTADLSVLGAPPADVQAERAVLAVAMQSLGAYREAAGVITPGDFYSPANGALWALLDELHTGGKPLDPMTVLLAAREHPDPAIRRFVADDGGYLAGLVTEAGVIPSVGYYCEVVADLAVQRRIIETGTRVAQRAYERGADTVELLDWAHEQLNTARDSRQGVRLLTEPIAEFMARRPEEPDWIIPGILARGDRAVFTGSGGIGKSTLCRQIAVTAAAGVHPFTHGPVEPVRVSVFDRENTEQQNQDNFGRMLETVTWAGLDVADTLRIDSKGHALDLLNPQDALSLLRTVEADQPDLVYIGPVYKLHNDDPDKEMVVKRITAVLDKVRECGCAVITEAHANKGGSLAPSGANLWTWWPEFGRGLRLDPNSDEQTRRCALERWRFDRQPREWPDVVQAGSRWPWVAAASYDDYGRAY